MWALITSLGDRPSRGPRFDRQIDVDVGAPVDFTGDIDGAAVGANNFLANDQSEAGAFVRRFGRYEKLKNLRQDLRRYPRAAVSDFDSDAGCLGGAGRALLGERF